MCKVSETFESLVDILANKARKCIQAGESYRSEKVLDIVLAAFNTMQEDEFNGDNYIFNINNENDLKYLVDREIVTAASISYVYENYKNGLFTIDENGNPQPVHTLPIILCNNIEPVIRCMLMYPEDSTYNKLYNLLIADTLISSDFNSLR